MNYEPRTNKAFTLIELVVAIAILVMVITFAGVIFKVSINSHRTAAANAEIMRKLRAITDQLNADFRGLGKNGYLVIHSEVLPGRIEYANSNPADYRADRLYYFTTGDFQTWLFPNVRSNITKVYFGHDSNSLTNPAVPASKWSLARDVRLITPGYAGLDHDDFRYAQFKAEVAVTEADAASVLTSGIPIDIHDPCAVRGLMCQDVGEILIEWTDGTKYPDNSLAWFGFSVPRTIGILGVIPPRPEYDPVENVDTSVPPADYVAAWTPDIPAQYWPKALKFTFTIYDSRRILEQGRLFTHIVYFGD